MVLLNSVDVTLGSHAPDFSLPSVDDKIYRLDDVVLKNGVLIAFICNHCPYVQAIEDRLIHCAKELLKHHIGTLAICSNDPEQYPDDNKENLLKRWQEKRYNFPYVIDAEQTIARLYGAVCTPDLFLYDKNKQLFYHGQLDNNWRDKTKVSEHDLYNAALAMLEGNKPPVNQKPCMGCSIKWKNVA